MSKHEFRPGKTFKVDPDIAAAELERVRSEHEGKLEPKAVVDASRPKEAPAPSGSFAGTRAEGRVSGPCGC